MRSASAVAPGSDPASFFRWAHRLAVAGDPRFVALGPVEALLAARADEVGRQRHTSVWHMTHLPGWPEVRAARALVAGRHGVDLRYVTTERSLEQLPLLSSHHHPYLRVAPVIGHLLVLDRTSAFIGAPLGHPLTGTVWTTTSPPVVAEGVRCFETVWAGARPVPAPGEEPPFTRRMVAIGFLLTEGASDREIARELHVSQRTVSAEVAEMVRRLGARSRAHAIALIGRGTE
jgi:DNA-binding CsgD family transcriptional regulator